METYSEITKICLHRTINQVFIIKYFAALLDIDDSVVEILSQFSAIHRYNVSSVSDRFCDLYGL